LKRWITLPVQRKIQIAEIDATHQCANRRHDDIVDERGDDFTECGADDDADGEIDDVSAGDKLTEFSCDFHSLIFVRSHCDTLNLDIEGTWQLGPDGRARRL